MKHSISNALFHLAVFFDGASGPWRVDHELYEFVVSIRKYPETEDTDNLTTVRGALTPVNDDNQLNSATYDGDGNPTTYNGSALTFDIEDRLTATSFLTAGYYDDGTRAWKQPVNAANGYRAYFLYDGGHLVAEIEHDGTLRNLFGWSTAGLLERYQASNNISYVYTYDPSGNVVMRHDSSPSADCDYTTLYDAFGAQHGCLDPLTQTQSQQAKQDMVGFGGEWGYYTDQESVSNPTNPAVRYLWVRCGVRDYDSATARWLERDPISYDGGINVYSFCENNPVTKSDPNGKDVSIIFFRSSGELIVVDNQRKGADGKPLCIEITAFSGVPPYRNDPKSENIPMYGPIPKGRYVVDLEKPDTDFPDWYVPLYHLLAPDGKGSYTYKKAPFKGADGKIFYRDGMNLHPGLISFGCVTVPSEIPKDSKLHHGHHYPWSSQFDRIRSLISKTRSLKKKNSHGRVGRYAGWLYVFD